MVFDILERKEWLWKENIEVLKRVKEMNFFLSLFFTEITSEKIVFGFFK